MVQDRKAVGVCKDGMHPRAFYPWRVHIPRLPSEGK